MYSLLKRIHSRTQNSIEKIRQKAFLSDHLFRTSKYSVSAPVFVPGDSYWSEVAGYIKRVADEDSANFFLNPVVVLHLASEDLQLGYRLLKRIQSHPLGMSFLHKCSTPSWGHPFILRKFPSLSPTTASHIANLISLFDHFGHGLTSLVDFGGGYGGFALCAVQASDFTDISIIDYPDMLSVQKTYLAATSATKFVRFFESVSHLPLAQYDVFNASFSFSESPIATRANVADFILKKCNRVHIIFQELFNGIDNRLYMNNLKLRLQRSGWQVTIKSYDWYGWNSALVLVGSCSRASLKDPK